MFLLFLILLFRAEAVRSALDVLVVCSVTPKFQAVLCENVPVSGDEGHNTVGMRYLNSNITLKSLN